MCCVVDFAIQASHKHKFVDFQNSRVALNSPAWRSRRYTFVRFFNLRLTNLLPLDAWSDMHQALMSAGKAWMFKASRVQRWLHNGHFITTRPRSDPPQRGGEKVGSTHWCWWWCKAAAPTGHQSLPILLTSILPGPPSHAQISTTEWIIQAATQGVNYRPFNCLNVYFWPLSAISMAISASMANLKCDWWRTMAGRRGIRYDFLFLTFWNQCKLICIWKELECPLKAEGRRPKR